MIGFTYGLTTNAGFDAAHKYAQKMHKLMKFSSRLKAASHFSLFIHVDKMIF